MTPRQTVVVPACIVVDLRTGLYAQIGLACEQLDSLTTRPDREHHPERYRKPLQDLDRVRSLLEAIGWSQSDRPVSVEIDVCEHRRALLSALETMLEAIEDLWSGGVDAAPSTPPVAKTARRRARAIQTFVHDVRVQDQSEEEQLKGDKS